MKPHRNIFLFILLITAIPLHAGYGFSQSIEHDNNDVKTLSNGKGSNGGYGAISVGYTRIDENSSIIGGLKGGWTVNHSLTIGGAIYGFYNSQSNLAGFINSGMGGGYAGLLLEPVFWGTQTVHISVPLIIGGGGATKYTYDPYTYTTYFIFVPGIELEINITNHFRIALGVDYRLTPGLTWKTVEDITIKSGDKVLNGFSGHLVFKFGKL